jgi:hypothetical protein
VRIAQGRARAAVLVAAVFAAVTLLVNAPVAIEGIAGGTVQLREGWTWFFEFSHGRLPESTLWSVLNVGLLEANRWSGVLLGVGLGALLGLAARAVRRGQDVLLPAGGAALLWFFATGKVYSAQYSLWILLALALAGLPLRAMIAFAAIDVLLYVTLWGGLPWLGAPWPGTFLTAARQGGTAVLAIWVMARIAAPTRDSPDGPRGQASPSVLLVFRGRQRPRAGPA